MTAEFCRCRSGTAWRAHAGWSTATNEANHMKTTRTDIDPNTVPAGPTKPTGVTPAYARRGLTVLLVVYVLNFIDRQILSVLAEDIKHDLGLSDADLGFLYGTAFGVFYALFGIPLGRLADNWSRIRLMTAGLSIWSVATAFSGLATSSLSLGAARIGVGVGEATASPCAYSLISDWFPKRLRATALAIYSSGIYIGSGISLFLGGFIVQAWNSHFPSGGPFGLVGWQAAFMVVGVPGLLLALIVSRLREPVRGAADGVSSVVAERPFRELGVDLLSIMPPFTLVAAARSGKRSFLKNLICLTVIAASACFLAAVTGDQGQWITLGVGLYAVFSWAAALGENDKPAFALMFKTRVFVATVVGFGLVGCVAYAATFWATPYAIRVLGMAPQTAGMLVGSLTAAGGFLGMVSGGRLADRLRISNPVGRIKLMLAATALLPIPYMAAFLTEDRTLFVLMQFPVAFLSSCSFGASAATLQDLVLPRMRGTAAAAFFLGTTLIGLSLGPYLAGSLSRATGDLGVAMALLLWAVPLALLCFGFVHRHLAKAERTLLRRARMAGEIITQSGEKL